MIPNDPLGILLLEYQAINLTQISRRYLREVLPRTEDQLSIT